jgi:hypothetical protein
MRARATFINLRPAGFLPKPGGIRIITFLVTTRLRSKSNRDILQTTFVI